MDGFELEETHYHLFFEDAKLSGLEVVMARMTIGETMEYDKVRFRTCTTLEEIHARIERLAEILGEHLVSWNLRKNGLPVSCDAKGLLAVDELVLDAMVPAYVMATREVPAPLALSSSGTEPASSTTSPSDQAPSIPMEPLSSDQTPPGS